jgi:hypothetical protein
MSLRPWPCDIIGIDPSQQHLSVLAVGDDAPTGGHLPDVLGRFRSWGWRVTVLPLNAGVAQLRHEAAGHDVALFAGTIGNRRLRGALSADLPTVATVGGPGPGRDVRLLAEMGGRRTTVLIVHRPVEARILRKISASALVRLEPPREVGTYALHLGAVLLRAQAWWR